MNATISIDRKLKEQAEAIFGNYGMSLSDIVSNVIGKMIEHNRTAAVSAKSNAYAFGSLSKYANANLRKREKDVWEIYAKEKYGSR
jgi:antitoxin component of RelBE/YafQ-DinJ toxin-antitoxin module